MTRLHWINNVWRPGIVWAVALLLSIIALGCGDVPVAPPQGVEIASVDRIASLIEDARGKALVINVWATWCPPCVSEMPELAAFYNARDTRKVEFLSLSYDDPKKIAETVKPFREKYGLPFPVLVVENLSDLSALDKALRADLSGVLPTTLLYDPQGNAAKVWEGPVTHADLDSALQSLP